MSRSLLASPQVDLPLPGCNSKQNAFRNRSKWCEGREEGRKLPIELTDGLTFASPVLARRSPSVVEVLGGRGVLSRLDDCGEGALATSRYQRTQETDKRAGIDYLDQIGQDGAFVPCSLGAGPSKRFVDPRRRWTWSSRQISRKTKTPVPSNEICRRRSSQCGQIAPAEKIVMWTFFSLLPGQSLSAHSLVRFFRVSLRSNIS